MNSSTDRRARMWIGHEGFNRFGFRFFHFVLIFLFRLPQHKPLRFRLSSALSAVVPLSSLALLFPYTLDRGSSPLSFASGAYCISLQSSRPSRSSFVNKQSRAEGDRLEDRNEIPLRAGRKS